MILVYFLMCSGFLELTIVSATPIQNDLSESTRTALDHYMAPIVKGLSSKIEDLEARYTADIKEMTNRIRALEEQHPTDADHLAGSESYLNTIDNQVTQTIAHSVTPSETLKSKVLSKPQAALNNAPPQRGSNNDAYLLNDKTSSTYKENKRSIPNELSIKRNRVSGRVQPSTGQVAFHALVSQEIVNPGMNHIIPFGSVITNVGGHYSSQTGVFTCVTPGVYVFSWSIRAYPSLPIDTEIVRNGNTVGYSANGDTTYAKQGSATVVVELQQDDEVWVKVANHSPGADIYPSYSMFFGFLLK